MPERTGNYTGKQKRQRRLLQKRLEQEGLSKEEASARSETKVRQLASGHMKGGGGRLVSKRVELSSQGLDVKPAKSKSRK